jgi:TonB family protein
MGRRSIALKAVLATLALPGATAEARSWPRAGGWDIAETDGGCGMGSEFEGSGETHLMVLLDADGDTFVVLTNSGWSTKEGEDYELTYILNGSSYSGGITKGTKIEYRPGFLTKMGDGFLNDFAAGSSFRIYRGETLVDQLSLSGSAAGVAMLRRCTASVKARLAAEARERARLAHIPADPFAAPRASAPAAPPAFAQPRANLSSLFSTEDYPAAAVRAGEQGTVEVKLSVGANGRVTNCVVTSSSGSSALDSTTCRLLTARARFTPATDSAGSPVAAEVTHRQRWRLPD